MNKTLLTFLVLYLLLEGMSLAARYVWLNWGQPEVEKLKSKAKKRYGSAAVFMLLLWPMDWGIVATLFSTSVQLPDALLNTEPTLVMLISRDKAELYHQWSLWVQVASEAPMRVCTIYPSGATRWPSCAPKRRSFHLWWGLLPAL